jgi:hypothetical protein
MKICPQCEKENPSSANHCMICGTELVEEEQLSEEAKLIKKIKKLEKENELKNKLLKKQLEEENTVKKKPEKQEILPPPVAENTSAPMYNKPPLKKKKTVVLLTVLFAVPLIVFGIFYYSNIYLPAKIDREAARYYTFADAVNLRSSQIAGVDYNRISSLKYGSELITYNHGSEWSEVKDAQGNKGYISSIYLLDKADFDRLNVIWGDTESKECISTAKCRLALLNYFKDNNLGSEWKTFCRPQNTKPNNVFFSRIYNKNSKYSDFAVIIKDTNTDERKILIFGFNDDESLSWTKSGDAPANGYIKNIYLTYSKEIYVDYSY